VLFSSSSSSSVLSYSFSLRDFLARGYRRQFSLLLISKERQPLVVQWPKLQDRLGSIVKNLQAKADIQYSTDCHAYNDGECSTYLRQDKHTYKRRGDSKPVRNLKELTQDPEVFESLHQDLVTLLGWAEQSLKEAVVTGQRLRSSVRSQESSLVVVRTVRDCLEAREWHTVLYLLLAGKSLQIRSSQRHLSRTTSECLCLLLPNNLPSSTTLFANLLLADPELELPGPRISIEPGPDLSPSYSFLCGHSSIASCSLCSLAQSSCIVRKFESLFSNTVLPPEIQEMRIRTEVERCLLQSRIFLHLTEKDRKTFLTRSRLSSADYDILVFFHMFS